MRSLLAISLAALAAFFLSPAGSAVAGGKHSYMICWTLTNGGSDCAYLPSDYRLSWAKRPYCNRRKYCNKGTVSFALTRDRIRSLSRYIDTETMRPTHTATIYAKTYSG